jgi:hypothetical protein
MKKQKRFTKQFEIEAEIIAQKSKKKKLLVEAEKLEDKLKEQVKLANRPGISSNEREFFMDNSRVFKGKADRLRRRAFLIETQKLPALKNALAELKTQPLPGIIGEDTGVVLKDN